jgi:flagellar hook protein FlgE
LDDTGNLLTNQGLSVMGIGNTPIKIDPLTGTNPLQSFKIEKDGTVLAYYANGTAPINKGQVLLTGFANPNALMRVGDNLLSNGTQTDGAADGPAGATDGTADTNSLYGNIIQGTLELSNVDLTQQFSDLIVAQRAFQANSRVITVSDSVMDEIVNLKR